MPRFHCNGWCSITVSAGMPETARVRVTHAFAHVAIFSQRASGVGIGTSSPLKPQLAPASLLTLGVTEPEVLHSLADGRPGEGLPLVTTPVRTAQPTEVGYERKRKAPKLAGGSSITDALGNLLPQRPGGPDQSFTIPYEGVHSPADLLTSLDVTNGDDSLHLQSPTGGEVQANCNRHQTNPENWPSNSSGHQQHQQHSLTQRLELPSQGHQPPSLLYPILQTSPDLHDQARVLFPNEYLAEIRQKINFALAEAERPGGVTIEEARAFETAFAPLIQLVGKIEARVHSET